MTFYLILFTLVCFFSFIYTYSKEKNVAVLSKLMVFILLFIPLALRKDIGTDYKNYVKIFNEMKSGIKISQEFGWQFLNYIVIKLNLNVQWIFIISAFLTVLFILQTPKKELFITVILFFSLFYLESFNVVRQALAMSICWYSFLCFNKGLNKRAIIFLIFAISFHYAAILVAFAFIFMNKQKLSEKAFFVLLVFSFILVESGFLLKILTFILSFTKYGIYLSRSDLFSNLVSGGIGGLATFTVRSIILIGMYYFLPKSIDEKQKNYCRVCVLCLFVFDLLGVNVYMFQRVRIYFFLSYMVVFYFLYHQKSELRKSANIIFVLFFVVYYMVLKLLTGAGQIIPYMHI